MILPMDEREPLPEIPVDPRRLADELQRRIPALQEQLRCLEEAKKVSRKTMEMVITI